MKPLNPIAQIIKVMAIMFKVLPYVIEIINGNHILICPYSIDKMSYYCYEWFFFTSFNRLLIQSVRFKIITFVV
jgi:hypothetical protein